VSGDKYRPGANSRANRVRVTALSICGAMLAVLTCVGLQLQSENRLDHFLVVGLLQSAVYLAAVWLAWNGGSSWRTVLGVAALALAMRVPVVLTPPFLSNDVYRYVWDGRIEAAGFNPYRYEPADPRLEALRDQSIYPRIGSKYAPTIYPPLAEAIYLVVSRLAESVTAMKAAMVVFEAITFVLLARLLALEGLPTSRVLIYAWHPLPVWEFAGSGHIDAALIACSLVTLWAVRRRRSGLAGVFLAGATLAKLYPAVLAPVLYRRWDWKMPVAFTAAMVIAYIPFAAAGSQIFGFLPGYAGQEGFDAAGTGFYLLGLLRRLPTLEHISTHGYEIGAVIVLAAVSFAFAFRRDRDGPSYAMSMVSAAAFVLLLSPHYPWYFSWLIVFACFVRSFAVLWLTNACLLLYFIPGYVFVPSDQRLVIESIIYWPFITLALLDICAHLRRSARAVNSQAAVQERSGPSLVSGADPA
jgi:alpha-1,6-mannosyltransferase